MCAHIFVIFFGPLFFVSLIKYFPPFVFYFCCWFFLPHFFVTLLHKDKKCCLGGNNTPLPTTRIKWATNSRRTRRECRCATPLPSVVFFCSRASESFTFFCKRDDAMSSSLAERSRYITIRKRLTQRDFCLLV